MSSVKERSIRATLKTRHFGFWAALVVPILILAANLFGLNSYSSSLGTDTFVLYWPIGQQLENSVSLYEFFYGLSTTSKFSKHNA